jgi:hypothetical protein
MKFSIPLVLVFLAFPFSASADQQPPVNPPQPGNIPDARIRLTDNSQVGTPLADCLTAAYAKQSAGKFGEILSYGDLDYLYTEDGNLILNMVEVPVLTNKKDDDKKYITARVQFQAPLRDVWHVFYYGDGQDAMEAAEMLPFANVVDKKSAPLFRFDLTACRDLFVHN